MFRFSFCSAVVRKFTYLLFFVSLALTANVVLANVNIRVGKVTEDSISISWRAVPGVALYFLGHTRERGGDYTNVGETTGTSYTFKDLRPYTWYRLNVDVQRERLLNRRSHRRNARSHQGEAARHHMSDSAGDHCGKRLRRRHAMQTGRRGRRRHTRADGAGHPRRG